MCPVLQLLLMVAAGASGSSPDADTGLDFVVVFLENIAYYHPVPPRNSVRVTASRDGTTVTISAPTDRVLQTLRLRAGETQEFWPDHWLELRKKNVSDRVLSVRGDRPVSVHAVNLKLGSVQTALVIPVRKLGRRYAVPPLPRIPGTTDAVSADVTERRPFALYVVSAARGAAVVLGGNATRTLDLDPYQVAQVLLREAEGVRWVKSDAPVAVVLGHACALRVNCTCGLLQAALPPARSDKVRFFIPPFLPADGESRLLVSPKNSTPDILPFDPSSPLVDTDGAVLLFRPGLLLPLITEADFASCFLLSAVGGARTFAVITVRRDSTGGVRMGSAPLDDAEWEQLSGTDLVWSAVELRQQKNVLWHSFHKMAVYFYGKNGSALFGNVAPIISTTPDFRGCLLDPEVLTIGPEAAEWRESVRRCRAAGADLLSLSTAVNVTHVHSLIRAADNGSAGPDAWIGLRRSSQSGAWYWIDNGPVGATSWREGEPGAVNQGQCAALSLRGGELGWSDEDCCRAVAPVCYRPPVFFPL